MSVQRQTLGRWCKRDSCITGQFVVAAHVFIWLCRHSTTVYFVTKCN